MTGSREDLHGSLKLAITNYFRVRNFLANYFLAKHFGSDFYPGLYAENYEPGKLDVSGIDF